MNQPDALPVSPLTGDHVARHVTGGMLTKVVGCTFHHTLPWIAVTPKHGHTAAIWDYNSSTLVGTVDVFALLCAQLSSVVPSGEWTPDQCGALVTAEFLDKVQLEWKYELNKSQRYDPACPSRIAAAGPAPVPSPLHSSAVSSAALRRGPLSLDGSSLTMSGAAGGGAGADGLDGASHAAAHDAMKVCVVTSRMAIVADVATSTVTHALTPLQIQNRTLVAAKLVVMETAARYGYTREALHGFGASHTLLPGGMTPGMLGDLTAEMVIGCSDGSVLVWTITPPPTQLTEVASNARFAARSDILRVIKTPSSSPVNALGHYTFINTTTYKRTVPEDQTQDEDDTEPDIAATFAARRRTSFVSIVYGTKGGTVGHIALCGAPESFVQTSVTAAEEAANAGANGDAADDSGEDDGGAGASGLGAMAKRAGHSTSIVTTILWSKKNVHSRVLSLAVSLMPPSLLYSASDKVYVCDSTTVDELVLSFCNLRVIYALGPDALTIHHGRTGVETRRLTLGSAMLPSAPVDIIVTHFSLLVVCEGDDHVTLALDASQESVRPWLRLSNLIPVTSKAARHERQSMHPVGRISRGPSVLPPGALNAIGVEEPPFTPSDADLRVYSAVIDPAHPNGQLALLTNEGCIVMETEAASTTVCSPGVVQSQFVFPLPAQPGVHGHSGQPGARRKHRRHQSPHDESSGTTSTSFLVRGKARVQLAAVTDSIFAADAPAPPGAEGAPKHAARGASGLAASSSVAFSSPVGSSGVGFETRLNSAPHYMLGPMHQLSVGMHDNSSDVLPIRAREANATSVTLRTVLEPSPTFSVRGLFVTPRADLVAIVTDTRELLVYELSATGSIAGTQLIVPPSVKQGKPDAAAWAHDGCFIAMLDMLSEARTITVGALECRAGHYSFLPQAHTIPTSNVPRGLSGGRWLCVHFEQTFSGITSQFHRWESGNRGGGGALGGFIPQPRILEWDTTCTICALVYDSSITFMHAHRKVFSVFCSTELRSTPLQAKFVRRSLILILHREIVMLLPTASGVHKVVLASTSANQTSTGGASKGLIASRSSAAARGATFDSVVHLRPLGNLMFAGFDEAMFDLYVADDLSRICRIPLAGTIAHLLWTLHSAPFGAGHVAATSAAPSPSSDTGGASASSTPGVHQRPPPDAHGGWRAAYDMLSAFLRLHVGGATSRLLVEAVEDFAKVCGCADLLAHCKGVDALGGNATSPATPGGLTSDMSGSGSGVNVNFATTGHHDPVMAAVISALEKPVEAALVAVHQIAGDTTRSRAQREAHLEGLRRSVREIVVREVYACTAGGWAISDGRVPETVADWLLQQVRRMQKKRQAAATADQEQGAGGATAEEANDPRTWQVRFLEDLAHEFIVHRYN